jgi:hypothetical protein
MAIFLSLSRVGGNARIMLPPPGEFVTPEDAEPVKLVGQSTENRRGTIVDVRLEPERLAAYVNVAGLRGAVIEPQQEFVSKAITLRNDTNPPLGRPLEGVLELTVQFDGQEGGALVSVPLALERFPEWQGTFAIDFGNTSSTCVVLPASVHQLFHDKSFRCLNLDDPNGPETSQATAIRFDEFSRGAVTRWEVGNVVLQGFREAIGARSVEVMARSAGYLTGGIKRYLAAPPDEVVRTVSSRDGRTRGPDLTGDQLNGYALKRFIRRSQECRLPGEPVPVGLFIRVVATHPVNYTPIQLDALRRIYLDLLGIPAGDPREADAVDLRYDEATAAALYYLAKQFHGAQRIHELWARTDDPAAPPPESGEAELHTFNMLVFDCGGGTTDIALMRVVIERRTVQNAAGFKTANWFEVRPTVWGLTGLKDFAGDNMTLEALKLLRFRLAEKMAKLGQELDVGDDQGWSASDRTNFATSMRRLREFLDERAADGAAPELMALTEEYCKRIVPTDFGSKGEDPFSQEYRLRLDLFHQLWKVAEDLKRGLSARDAFSIDLPDRLREMYRTLDGKTLLQSPDFQSLEVRREELDVLLAGQVRQAWDLAADLCTDLDEGQRVHQVVLAGNGSLYPLVKRLLRESFAERADSRFEYQEQHVLFSVEDAKFACVKGAAIAEWYRTQRPDAINTPDQTVVSLRTDSVARLPYPYLYMTEQGFDTLFRRGQVIPPDQKYFERELAFQPRFVIKQGLQKDQPDNSINFCLFNCDGVPRPVGMPAAAKPRVVFRVDHVHEITAALIWAHDGQTVEVPLRREPLPEPPDAKYKNPFKGWN